MTAGQQQSLLRAPLLTGGVTAASVLLVHLVDPNRPGSYGVCPLRLTTGLLCPVCGGLRAVHAMTNGQWDIAWGMNPAVVALLPVAIVLWLAWLVRAWQGHGSWWWASVGPTWALLAGMVAFAVLRNLPALQPHLAALT